MPTASYPEPSKAFTLVELMVVITIIVVLLALLVPALDKAMEQAEYAMCGSNLRSILSGHSQYALESKGQLPPGRMLDVVTDYGNPTRYATAPNFLSVLIVRNGGGRKMFVCPATTLKPTGATAPNMWSDTSYMANGAAYGRRINKIDRPHSVIAVQELIWRSYNAWYRPYFRTDRTYGYWHLDTFLTYPGKETYGAGHRFGEKDYATNVPFFDGHVEHRLGSTLTAADFGLTGGPNFIGDAQDTHDDADNRNYRSRFD